MRRFAVLTTVAALTITTTFAIAQPGGGAAGKGPKGGKGGKGGPPDVAQMATRLIQKFDKSGDGALNQQELVAALTAMREMRANGGRPGQGGPGKGGPGQGKGGFGKGEGKGGFGKGPGKGGFGKGEGKGKGKSGGARPKRPAAE